ncbi:MFS transporter [Streptomyces sp. NPDC001054]
MGRGTDGPTRTRTGPGAAVREGERRPAGPARVTGRGVLLLTTVATVLAMMNYTGPLVTVPATVADLGTGVSAQSWLLNGTPLGLAAVLLVAGSLADDLGRRRMFTVGVLALGVTTGLGALAPSTALFTVARVAQGAASAAVLTSSLGLIAHAFPGGAARIKATGMWGAGVSAGIALGPLLFGAFGPLATASWAAGLRGAEWRAGYVVLAVLLLLLAALLPGRLPEWRTPREGRADVAGAVVLGAAAVALLAGLTWGRDGWGAVRVWVVLGAALVLAAVFLAVERRAPAPLLAPGLLRQRRFLGATAGGLFTGLAVLGFFSYLPTLMQQALGLGPFTVSLLSAVWAGTALLVALQARRLTGRVTAPRQLAAGFLLSAIGVATLWNGLAPGSTWKGLVLGLVVAGAGSGLLNAALPLVAVESVPPERAAMGSGANNTARYLGASTGVALSVAVSTTAHADTLREALAEGANRASLTSIALSVVGAGVVLALGRRGATR